jgi:AAA15 family ATPase/GTPase
LKIRELAIKNFKNIKELHMRNVPDLVVIAGPNGCGKTSIFDAIRILKAIIGPYSSGELNQIQTIELRNELRNAVNLTAEFAEITVGIELSESEKKYLLQRSANLEEILSQNQGLLRSSLKITKTGGYEIPLPSPLLSELLKHYDPTDEIGTFEYIPSYREVPMGVLGSITLSPASLEEEKLERTARVREKFSRLKYYLVMMILYDKMELSDTASKFLPEIQSFFKEFFFPKEFEGIKVDRTLNWHFPIKMPDGTHDMDFLSSGEKEILMTYTNILKMKLTGSVILFDEPDLHLNAALEKKLIGRLNRIVATGNQMWIATHSLEIIGTVPLENLYKMYTYLPEGAKNQIELCSMKKDRFEAFELIGASTGIQLISQKIVFVEGKADKEILQNLYEEFGDVLSFVETKGLRPLMGLSSAITDLLDQVTKYETFYMIRDKDLLSDQEAEEICRKYADKVFIWNVRSIENYLLDPQAILQVLDQLGIKPFDNKESVLKALKDIADDLKVETLADMVKYGIRRSLIEIEFGLPRVSTEEDLKKSVLEIGRIKRSDVSELFTENALEQLFQEKKILIDSSWDANSLKLCDGERMLQEFINRHIKPYERKIDVPSLRSLIINQMRSTKEIPQDIESVMRRILGEKSYS